MSPGPQMLLGTISGACLAFLLMEVWRSQPSSLGTLAPHLDTGLSCAQLGKEDVAPLRLSKNGPCSEIRGLENSLSRQHGSVHLVKDAGIVLYLCNKQESHRLGTGFFFFFFTSSCKNLLIFAAWLKSHDKGICFAPPALPCSALFTTCSFPSISEGSSPATGLIFASSKHC